MRTNNQILSLERDSERIARVSAEFDSHFHREASAERTAPGRDSVEIPCALAPGARRRPAGRSGK